MRNYIEFRGKKYTFSRERFGLFLNWFLISVLAFISVVLTYQLLLAGLSVAFGYETHLYFVRVDSLPRDNAYWSTGRVMIMYAFPAVFLILVSLYFLGVLHGTQLLNRASWFRLWFIVYGVLYGTAQMSISLFSGFMTHTNWFQGYCVLMHWFDLATAAAVTFIVISIFINIAFGFLCSRLFIFQSPPIFIVKSGKSHRQKITLFAFVLPISLVFPIAVFLCWPDYFILFAMMFLQVPLWLPGMVTINHEYMLKRASREFMLETYSNARLIGIALFLIVIIMTILS